MLKYNSNMIYLIIKLKKYKISHNNYKKPINKNNLNWNSKSTNKSKQIKKLKNKSIKKIRKLT